MNTGYQPDQWLLVALLVFSLFGGCISAPYRSQLAVPAQGTLEMSQTAASTEMKGRQPATIVWRGPENEGNVAITFDDGPNPEFTPAILDILAKHQAKATFFLVGEQAARYPELVRRIAAEGHVVASHTMSHPEAPKASGDILRREVKENGELLQRITGMPVRYFRPPYGYFNVDYFQASKQYGLTVVLWSIVPRDWERPPRDVLAKRAIDELQPGSIILLHDGGGDRTETVSALPLILNEIEQRQWRAVSLPELLK